MRRRDGRRVADGGGRIGFHRLRRALVDDSRPLQTGLAGGHGVSGTGVSGGRPAAHAATLSTTSSSIFVRV